MKKISSPLLPINKVINIKNHNIFYSSKEVSDLFRIPSRSPLSTREILHIVKSFNIPCTIVDGGFNDLNQMIVHLISEEGDEFVTTMSNTKPYTNGENTDQSEEMEEGEEEDYEGDEEDEE